eukprot:11806501-Alexandrium_andersonii.AAC.1
MPRVVAPGSSSRLPTLSSILSASSLVQGSSPPAARQLHAQQRFRSCSPGPRPAYAALIL